MRGKFFAALVIGVLFSNIGASAADITIGTGTYSWSYPLYTYYHDARTQTIYYASEIGGPKQLTSLALNVTTRPGQVMYNFTIRLKHTSNNYMPSTWDSSGWTTVRQSNLSILTTGWVTITFTTPFNYNGTQNLEVDISFNNSSGSSSGTCQYTNSSLARSVTYCTNSVYGDPLTWTGSTPTPGASTSFPNIRLGYATATVPNVVGMTQAAAQAAIISANLVAGSITQGVSDSVPVGSVISQSPISGQTVPIQTQVNLVVSIGGKYSGSGTAEDPYRISSTRDLLAMSLVPTDYNACFVLTTDIDLSGQTFTNAIVAPDTVYSYDPTYEGTIFNGTFDGNNHTIRNLKINAGHGSYLGLFGKIGSNGQVRNLNLESEDMSGGSYFGGLAGVNNGIVTNCHVTGSIHGYVSSSEDFNRNTGGLIGFNSGTVSQCSAIATVNGGGFCENTGGLIGYSNGTVRNCYSNGKTSGYHQTGGLIGFNDSYIVNCYAIGTAYAGWGAGGIAGQNSGDIENCYAVVKPIPNYDGRGLGGIAIDNDGYSAGTVINSFWDVEATGQSYSQGGTGKPTAEMQTLLTFTSAGWDFSDDDGDAADWFIPSGCYPQLVGLPIITVPDVIGLSQANAQTAITNANLTVGIITQAYSNSVPAGIIISQSPAAGESVNLGSSVNLVVSLGVSIPVPNVVGMTQAAAQTALASVNLTVVNVTQAFSNSVPAGIIISQSPAAGTVIHSSSPVNLVVSVGVARIVPNVYGMTKAAAQAAITSANLTIGIVTWAYHGSVPAGNVIGQSPSAGTSAVTGSSINLVISLGQCPYSGGGGTAANPYQIASKADLLTLAATPSDYSKSFILMADIDLTGEIFTAAVIAPDTQGSSDFQGTAFMGTFDGNGYTIFNLTIAASSQDFVGLFGYVGTDGQVKNLGMENVDITGNLNVGSLVGHSYRGTITSCHATGRVNGANEIGGLVGYNYGPILSCYANIAVSGNFSIGGIAGRNDASITSCYATGSVNGQHSTVGGLVGMNSSGIVTFCYASGSVYGEDSVGGLVGANYVHGSITSCYASGSVSGVDYVGGLVGDNYYTSITSCYATGSVNGNESVGGLAGDNSGKITSSYAAGSVIGNGYTGGLVGDNYYGSVATCFWDKQTSGRTTSAGGSGVQGKTTAEMKKLATFTSAGWDFINGTNDILEHTWFIREGQEYPRLMWEIKNGQSGLFPAGFVTINKTRVGRTSFEYELAVRVRNSNAFAMNNVQMKLMDWDAAVQSVSDDSIIIDIIPAGATVTSTDTFKIVVDRSTLINSSRLVWELTYYTVASGDQVQQAMMSMLLSDIDAGVPGDISGDGKVNFDDFAILAGQWDDAPGNPSADIAPSPDGHVWIEDLMYLADNWLK
jgi:beta-lactam-binding protein with PASTA domain